ncbi:retrovirus-related pol polyprotein from transposon TNT 1-94 [Tanacetum coccineum]
MTQYPAYNPYPNTYNNSLYQPSVPQYQQPHDGSNAMAQHYLTSSSSTPQAITHPSCDYHSTIYHNTYSPSPFIPQLEYTPAVQQQATIHDGRVTVQLVQGRQISNATGTSGSRYYNFRAGGSNSRKQRNVICYNCKREGHMAKQCIQPKRKRDATWFKDKVMLVQAQASRQVLDEEELAFLADPAVSNMNSSAQYDAMILSVIEQLKTQVTKVTKVNQDAQNANETLSAELESKLAIGFANPFYLKKAQHIEPKLYDGNLVINNVIVIPDSEETLMFAEESRLKIVDPKLILSSFSLYKGSSLQQLAQGVLWSGGQKIGKWNTEVGYNSPLRDEEIPILETDDEFLEDVLICSFSPFTSFIRMGRSFLVDESSFFSGLGSGIKGVLV